MTPQELIKRAKARMFPREKMQVKKRQTRYTYVDGPMVYLGQQIVKAMEDAGYPAKIIEALRSPERQAALKAAGRSRAGPWESPHQFWEAVDIVHPGKGWNVSEDYWQQLESAVSMVEEKFGVQLEHGHRWKFRDSAHIEMKYWRTVKGRMQAIAMEEQGMRAPNAKELAERFNEVLPKVWAERPLHH